MTEAGQIPAFEILGTKYPYLNVKDNLFNPLLGDLRRSVSSVNPFALRQVPSQDRMAFGLRWGNQFYSPNPYPNGIFFSRMMPLHYDPLSNNRQPDTTYQNQKFAPSQHGLLTVTADKLARPCVRQLDNFRRCSWVNGESNCGQEKQNIVNICPNWCLDSMKENTRFQAKLKAIQNNTYRRAMEVSQYNEGRTVSDVSDNTWVHGTRKYLRPDTMYPDERYANINQAEINEARKRHEARRADAAAHGHHKEHLHEHHYDFQTVPFKSEKPMYP